MKRLSIALCLLATPALAQAPLPPIVLSPTEVQEIETALAQRDPIIALLVRKQQEAAATAAAGALTPPAPPPGPKAP